MFGNTTDWHTTAEHKPTHPSPKSRQAPIAHGGGNVIPLLRPTPTPFGQTTALPKTAAPHTSPNENCLAPVSTKRSKYTCTFKPNPEPSRLRFFSGLSCNKKIAWAVNQPCCQGCTKSYTILLQNCRTPLLRYESPYMQPKNKIKST